MFRCNKCERSFKLYCHLKQHIKSHLGSLERPHVCSHCGKAYTREGALKQHINTFHFEAEELSRNQKPQKKVHVCEYCKKNFDHFGHFKEHLRKHTGEKPYECPDCHEKFARNSTLKCHMAACQNGAGAKKGRQETLRMPEIQNTFKKFKEQFEMVCGSVFNSWDQFKDHLASHTGDKPNHCTVCDMWFTHPKELTAHLKDAHLIVEKLPEQLVITDSAALTIATQNLTGAETVLLDDGIQVEHVTVEPCERHGNGGNCELWWWKTTGSGRCPVDLTLNPGGTNGQRSSVGHHHNSFGYTAFQSRSKIAPNARFSLVGRRARESSRTS
ncbi:Zinc finger protein 131 [Oryzias melastigma]|uniref:Zinc finger protein 131 n=1 Tax=Oryzias melastigma TaxID=30732 RepID=A0A834CKV3_ORYME|nr:Zinc finger protein 131 [Oryzias melastigma]